MEARTFKPLSESDLNFVLEHAAPDFGDKQKLKRLINEDEAFRKGVVADEKVFRRVVADGDIILKISAGLYFEVLLRRTFKELEKAAYTIERSGSQTMAVFDTGAVRDLLMREPVVRYLIDLLASFTRIESYVLPIRLRKGIWRKVRFNNMDIDNLVSFCRTLPEDQRLALYKRIADVCLFMVGVFPEQAAFDYSQPGGEAPGAAVRGGGRGAQEYEEEGRRFYRLAAEHSLLRGSEESEVMWLLGEKFNIARKPLNIISDRYLHNLRQKLFNCS